jgi:hypothetical protein
MFQGRGQVRPWQAKMAAINRGKVHTESEESAAIPVSSLGWHQIRTTKPMVTAAASPLLR